MTKLLKYNDLSEVFDETLLLDEISKLPISIIQESKTLNDKLTIIFNGIKSGNTKNNADNLGDAVYNYIKQSHILNSKNNKITEITTYYLNHTSSSYINTIKDAKNILENYFKILRLMPCKKK